MRVAQPLASKSFASELPVRGVAPRGKTRSGLVSTLLIAACLALSPKGAHASDYVYISGNPATTLTAGGQYSFLPSVSTPAASRSKIAFSIRNKPFWATFNTTTGLLTGNASSNQLGQYPSVTITASDGVSSAQLPPFTITVVSAARSTPTASKSTTSSPQGGSGSVTLYWTPATENIDGSTLTNLAGYIINYGTSASSLTNILKIPSTGVADYVVSNLAPATYYFDIRAYTTNGTESPPSGVVSTTVD